MAFKSLVLPILIGVVAAVLLLTILYNDPYIKSKFSDLGALIQLETSRPAYYGINWSPINGNNQLPLIPTNEHITSVNSPLYVDDQANYPVYNYYPQSPLNPLSTNKNVSITTNQQLDQDLAFSNPTKTYDAHKAYYWGLSGGYPYPYPMMYLPSTDMNKVKGIEDKI
jgi:hypothetical protein